MQFELINPSDPYTFIASDLEVAALTVFLLSTMYGAKAEDSELKVPIFLFSDPKEWYQKEFGRTTDEGLKLRKEEVSEALASFVFGDFADRKRYEAALRAITNSEKREEFMKEWHDGRSSLNDIGAKAHQLAKRLSG